MRSAMIAAAMIAIVSIQPARAQDAAAEIQAVISGQIAAFRADDFETAFTFASPTIKRLFGTPSRFGQMVQDGYPMVWRPSDVRFSGLSDRDGRMVQSVLVTDEAGVLYIVDYEMVTGDGGWQINGVTVRSTGDAGA